MGKSPEPLSGTARNACARAPERLETRTDGVECAYPLTAPVRSSFPLQRKRRQCCCTWMGRGSRRGGNWKQQQHRSSVRQPGPEQLPVSSQNHSLQSACRVCIDRFTVRRPRRSRCRLNSRTGTQHTHTRSSSLVHPRPTVSSPAIKPWN